MPASAMGCHADLLAHGEHRTGRAAGESAGADVLAERDEEAVDLRPLPRRLEVRCLVVALERRLGGPGVRHWRTALRVGSSPGGRVRAGLLPRSRNIPSSRKAGKEARVVGR